MAILVCYSRSPPEDHARDGAIYLNQRFNRMLFEHCRSDHGPYIILRKIASLRYKSPTLVVPGDRLTMLERELMNLEESNLSHSQIAEFRQVCAKAKSNGCALTISGDMFPEL